MKETELKQTAIFTPVFEETRYLHHICSECGGTLHFKQSIYGEVYFYDASRDTIKFCPDPSGPVDWRGRKINEQRKTD